MRSKNFTPIADRRAVWRRIAVYSAAFFLIGILQCAFFSRLKPFGAVPDITLGALCATLMLDNKKAAAVCAVAAGYFVDALGSLPPAFSPLFYLICIVLVSLISDKMMPRFASFCLCLAPAVIFNSIYTFICVWAGARALPSISLLAGELLGGALGTFIFSLPTYGVIKLCGLPLKELR